MPADPLAPLVDGSDRADNFPDSGGGKRFRLPVVCGFNPGFKPSLTPLSARGNPGGVRPAADRHF